MKSNKYFEETRRRHDRIPLFEHIIKEARLREIIVSKITLLNLLYQYFENKLNIDRSLLPNTFIGTMTTAVVKRLLKTDKLHYDDEGFILIPDEGARLRRGATYLQIQAFVDTLIGLCSKVANKMCEIPEERLKLFQKTFIQTFSDETANEMWKIEFAKYLTDRIAKSKPFYIKITNP